ncbi:MAG: potassium transporter TrkA [Candidatus Marinimicrobia bacterium]|nr:potassium transporter TrkA [Candidatus Neomarinimicrobiota bacterium]
MLAIFTLFIIIVFSIIINRVATIALVHTGLPIDSASFQARSALTGAGFTTVESEEVMIHPVRRKIIGWLMLIGNAGIVTVISTLILGFINNKNNETSVLPRLIVLIIGTGILFYLSRSKFVNRHLSKLIDKLLNKYSTLKIQDYASLMHLSKDYRIAELLVNEEDWIADRTLKESKLSEEGLLILGINRPHGEYIGTPRGTTQILPRDVLIVYGRVDEIKNVDIRRKTKRGDTQHKKAVEKQQEIIKEEGRPNM